MPDKSSQAAGQVFEPDQPSKPLHVLGRRLKAKALVTGLKGSDRAGHASKSRCGGESSQAGSIPVRLRVEKAGRDRGVRKAPRFPPQPLPSVGADVSPNLRVLMFASAAGGDALKQDDTGHWGRGGVG